MTSHGLFLDRCRVHGLCWAFAGGVILGACHRQEEVHVDKAALARDVGFEVALPNEFQLVQLRGEGSERMRAPSGARVERTARGFLVEAGSEFAVEVVPDAPPLGELVTPPGVSRVVSASDAAVFEAPGGEYSFVVVRELVPEWDEERPHRLSCGSAGGGVSGAATRADKRGFSKTAAQIMVAACRTLELPKLE
jgi:hypothetical protein